MPTPTRILIAPPGRRTLPGEAEAARLLAGGGIAVFPTDTFYGLGGSAFSAEAVEAVYALKGRTRGKPLPIVVADREMASAAAAALPESFNRLAAALWPGPLSLIVRAGPSLPPAMLGPEGTVAMRAPDLPWLRSLLARCGAPLISTSANPSGAPEIADPAEVRRLFEGRVDLIIDGGRTAGGAASTMVDLTRGAPVLLRPGAVSWDRILAALAAQPPRGR